MSPRNIRPAAFALLAIGALVANQLSAQYSPPDAYSITETNSLFGPTSTTKIYRSGSKTMIESLTPVQQGIPKETHIRTFYDLSTGREWSVDLNAPSVPCGPGNFSGDWGDPFAFSAEMKSDLAKQNARPAGPATMNGIATTVFEVNTPQGHAKAWVENKYGLMIKAVMQSPDGQQKTLVEVKNFSMAMPPEAIMALPAACAGVTAAPAPVPDSQKFAAETGGTPDDFANAILPPASHNSCSVLFRVVHAGDMHDVAGGFVVGLDLNQYANGGAPSSSVGVSASGRPRFTGGTFNDVTAQFRQGVLRLDNVPPHFNMDVEFGNPGSSSALIYRQCFQPRTVLLLVLKNSAQLSDGADWVWVKSGKFAAR